MRISDWSSDVCSSDLLGDRLGPILWQFMPTKEFDATDFGAFLELLPKEQDGLTLRHAVEVRHESFACAEFVELARALGVAIVEARAEERRVGKEWVSPGRSRGASDH